MAATDAGQKYTSLFDYSIGNRRSACDRCRSHKLRCEREIESSTVQIDCRRCLKANAKCVTGAALKSGRPHHLHGAQQQPHQHLEQAGRVNHQTSFPDFPTPPSSNFNTPPESNGTSSNDLVMPDFLPLATFDDIWTTDFEHETSSAQSGNAVTVPEGPLTPSDLSSEHLKKIATLQTGLLADMDTVKLSRRIDKIENLRAANDPGCNFLIGSTLHHSTLLLEILDYYNPKRPAAASSVTEPVTAQSFHCDVPTMMLLLSCYICLVRIYRTMFFIIIESVPLMPNLQTPAPQLFPGMNLGGFKLETRIDIQIQVLIQVSESMLAKIEARFGLGEDHSLSVFENGRALRMLRAMMEEESAENPVLNEPCGECGSLKNVLTGLKQLLQLGDVGMAEAKKDPVRGR